MKPEKPSLHNDPQGGTKLVGTLTIAWFILFAIFAGAIIGKIVMELITR